MIRAAEDVFLAMAAEPTIRPIVEGYQKSILATRTWPVSAELVERRQRRAGDEPVDEYVTDIKFAWTMEPEAFALFNKRCNEERVAAGLVVETEAHCPLLVAEHTTCLAKLALCDAMASVTSLSSRKVATMKPDDREKFVELTLRLLAPFVTNPLARYMA